ncbi:MAG: nitroreductase [Bacteroidetes bacterium HGW-Bacteroidetes-6]|jgi:SagB-type dehydrogenase family enzyme|nr:MAG: nitroreductase [Bacteroidetes bacterium HGW-Bacteroidetes-6]
MKKLVLIFVFVLETMVSNSQTIVLPDPQKSGGKPLMTTLNERQSIRDFKDTAMSLQQISNLLWAAYGINRAEASKRTAPSARNKQEFDLYVVDKNGIYIYQADSNQLWLVAKGDFRQNMGKQDFTGVASLTLVFVADYSRMGNISDQEKDFYSAADCGFISQNVYLFAASEGLATVVLGFIDREKMALILHLSDTQKIIFSQPVGFMKE